MLISRLGTFLPCSLRRHPQAADDVVVGAECALGMTAMSGPGSAVR